MRSPDWLTAQPIAHRGLHDAARGTIENMPGAFAAAIAGDFAIETDVQPSADGEAMVHHDDVLDRLTQGAGPLAALTAAELQRVPFKATSERMMTLGDLCDLVADRVPLVVEVKSRFDGDNRVVERIRTVLESYRGPTAVMSFDPEKLLAVRALLPDRPRGIVAQRNNSATEWPKLKAQQRQSMMALRHGLRTQPHFVSYKVDDLPSAAPWIARHLWGCALLCWTVRTPKQRAIAAAHADQITFEGYIPREVGLDVAAASGDAARLDGLH
jgi:glycerophosphoryl diester phosphodiesterase